MAKVRVLVGTRKGAFIITSDGARRDWNIEGPHFGGWEIMHVHGSPADADRLYASQWTDWHGQVVQRSDDGGRSWEAVGNEFSYEGVTSTHQWYDGTPHPWEFKRVWHLVLCSQSLFGFADLGDDGLCRGGPDKGCGVIVSAIDVVVDRLD